MLLTDRCTAEIGVENCSCSVDHHFHIRLMQLSGMPFYILRKHPDLRFRFLFFLALSDKCSERIHLFTDHIHHKFTSIYINQILYLLFFKQNIYFRNTAK